MIDKIIDDMDKVERVEGTGWNLHSIIDLELHTTEWIPQNGGSYIELDHYLKSKGAIINMKNKDNQCFKWCILRAFNLVKKDNEIIDKNLKTKENTLNMKKIEYPVRLQDINRFESLNPNISITVCGYGDEKKKVYPIRVNEEFNRPNKINLLLIERDGNTHYCLIKNLSRLLSSQVSKHNGKIYICPRCINPFKSEESLTKHLEYCTNTDCIKTVMPEKGKNDILKFINHHRSEKVPFIVYADIECLLKPIHSCQPDSKKSYTHKYQKHEPISFSYYIKCFVNNVYKPVLTSYTGKDAMEKFIEWLEEDIKYINDISSKLLIMEVEEEERFKNETKCWICKRKFNNDKDFKVRDHCHFTGRFRGAAHNSCNLKYKKPDFTPIVFHNLSGYDSHLFIRNLGNSEGDLDCIPNNDEKYISFSKRIEVGYYEKKVKNKKTGKVKIETKIKYHKMRFIDSNKFMNTSLDKLVNNLLETAFNNLRRYYTGDKFNLVKRKGVFPYEYLVSLERLEENKLPLKKYFFSRLTDKDITNEDYRHAKKVWTEFEMKTLKDYLELYNETDVLLLADVFENFRSICLENYLLDPDWYFTAPGLAWDAALKITKVELELLTDVDMLLMVEKGIRGGVSMISTRYAKANNKYMGNKYDVNEVSKYIVYFDKNNLYGTAMINKLPVNGFKWMNNNELLIWRKHPCILERDLEYPKDLHDLHNDYPLAPERVK